MRPVSQRSTFKASKFNHVCSGCGRRIRRGDMIWAAKRAGARCEACGRHPDGSEPTPAPSVPAFGGRFPVGSKTALRDQDGTYRVNWNSLSEAVEDALSDYADNDHNREVLRRCQRKDFSGRSPWSNFFTRSRFLGELSNPSPHLMEAVDRLREQIAETLPLPTTPRRRVRRGQDFGEDMDADRFLARNPNLWERSVREQSPRRNVTIACNVSVSAARRPDELLWRGAAAVALADALTQQGVNVEIVMMKVVADVTDRVGLGVVKCVLKESSMPLDLSAVTFALCEIAFARVVAVRGGARHWPGKLDEGFGYPKKLPEQERAAYDFVVEADVLTRDQAERWVRACLEQAAQPLAAE